MTSRLNKTASLVLSGFVTKRSNHNHLDPSTAALSSLIPGGAGPALYGTAGGGLGAGLRMGVRSSLESAGGGALGAAPGLTTMALAGEKNPKLALAGLLATILGGGGGYMAGGAHGAMAAAKNFNARQPSPLKQIANTGADIWSQAKSKLGIK